MFCQKCGKKLLDESKFCNYCGAQVAEIGIRENNNQNSIKNETKSDKKKLFNIIKWIVVTLAFFAPIIKGDFLLLNSVMNTLIWLGIFSLISLFIFPKSKNKEKQNQTNITEPKKALTPEEEKRKKEKYNLESKKFSNTLYLAFISSVVFPLFCIPIAFGLSSWYWIICVGIPISIILIFIYQRIKINKKIKTLIPEEKRIKDEKDSLQMKRVINTFFLAFVYSIIIGFFLALILSKFNIRLLLVNIIMVILTILLYYRRIKINKKLKKLLKNN